MKAESFFQFGLALLVFVCVCVQSVIAIKNAWVTGIMGYGAIAFFLATTGAMVRVSWKELREKEG